MTSSHVTKVTVVDDDEEDSLTEECQSDDMDSISESDSNMDISISGDLQPGRNAKKKPSAIDENTATNRCAGSDLLHFV